MDDAFGFSVIEHYLRALFERNDPSEQTRRLADGWPAILFWYRQSPSPLVPLQSSRIWADPYDPPSTTAGMLRIWMDTNGRLEYFGMVPPAHEQVVGPFPQPDWKPLLEAARLDPNTLKTVEPLWTPNVSTDVRTAWEGLSEAPLSVPVRVEAGGFHGRAVYFNSVWPWDKPPQERTSDEGIWARLRGLVSTGWFLAVLFGGVLLAKRNLRPWG